MREVFQCLWYDMLGGLDRVVSRPHNWRHSSVCDPSLLPWAYNHAIRRTRHFAATSVSFPCSFRRCKVDMGTLNTAPCHMYQVIAITRCPTYSFDAGKICAVCHILQVDRYAHTGSGVLGRALYHLRLSSGLLLFRSPSPN